MLSYVILYFCIINIKYEEKRHTELVIDIKNTKFKNVCLPINDIEYNNVKNVKHSENCIRKIKNIALEQHWNNLLYICNGNIG